MMSLEGRDHPYHRYISPMCPIVRFERGALDTPANGQQVAGREDLLVLAELIGVIWGMPSLST